MNTNHNSLWQRAVVLTVAGLLGLTLNAAENAVWLGVSVGPVADAVRHQLKLPRGAGLTVESVADESPAAKAGLERHDVLQQVDDQWLFNADQLTRLVRSCDAGDTVQLTVLRGGRPQSLSATLVEHEAVPEMNWTTSGPGGFDGMGGMVGPGGGMGGGGMWGGGFGGGGDWQPRMEELLKGLNGTPQSGGFSTGWAAAGPPTAFLGVVTKAPDEVVLEQLDRRREEGGVLIGEVIEDSPAAKAGLLQHDLIIELDGKGVADPRQFSDIIGRWKPGDRVSLKLLREGKPVAIEVTLGKREAADARQLQKLQQRFMVAPKVEVQTAPNQPGSVIIMQDGAGMDGSFGGGGGGFGGGGGGFGGGGGGFGGGGGGFGGGSAGGAGSGSHEFEAQATTTSSRVGTVVSRDQAGEITVRQQDENRHVTVKDAEGQVLFDGDVNSDADREKLPAEVRERLKKVDHLLQKNLERPVAPPSQRRLRVLEKETRPGFIRHEEHEVLTLPAEAGV